MLDGSEFSFHSSSDEGRKPPPEWFNDLSITGSVSCHSSDTSEEEYTGCSRMSVAFKKKFSKLRTENFERKNAKNAKRNDTMGVGPTTSTFESIQ
jgi:hypothetical protein